MIKEESWLLAACHIAFDVEAETPMVFMLRPRSGANQWVAAEEYHLAPSLPVFEYTDGFGNLCQRIVAVPGELHVHTKATVRVLANPIASPGAEFVNIADLPNGTLSYLLPSRYCESDRFSDMAADITAGYAPGNEQVLAIVTWVRNNIRNIPLSSTYPISATEVNLRGEGVCRDLAHVAIALCRAICIPARFVVGYLNDLEPMDAHAWFEAFIGGRWHTFDPSVAGDPGARIAVAVGRDATDVALYNQYGPLLLPRELSVAVTEIDEPIPL